MPNFAEYDGLTYYSAAHHAGLMLCPVPGPQRAIMDGGRVYFGACDPDDPRALRLQRAQFVDLIAARLVAQHGGSLVEHAEALDAAILPV